MPPRVAVLLSTYNGQPYLEAQLNSVLAQTYPNWTLLARDDGSSDASQAMLQAYARVHPDKVALLEEAENLGASLSFSRLLEQSDAEYFMFCDQDDIWLPDKIALTLTHMQVLEAQWGEKTPLLVHTDLSVVDGELNMIADSFWRFQHLDPKKTAFTRLLVQNVVTGCTVMINRPLKTRALPVPAEAIMHDWWLALVAAAFGRLDHLQTPTILYRQHGRNEVGAKRWGADYVLGKALTFHDSRALKQSLLLTQRQARALAERYGAELPDAFRERLLLYAHLDKLGFFQKRLNLLKYGFLKIGLARNIGLLLRI